MFCGLSAKSVEGYCEMRNYIRFLEVDNIQDCGRIAKHICPYNGYVQFTQIEIQRLWEAFSRNIYCSSWAEVNDDNLTEFAKWLGKTEAKFSGEL